MRPQCQKLKVLMMIPHCQYCRGLWCYCTTELVTVLTLIQPDNNFSLRNHGHFSHQHVTHMNNMSNEPHIRPFTLGHTVYSSRCQLLILDSGGRPKQDDQWVSLWMTLPEVAVMCCCAVHLCSVDVRMVALQDASVSRRVCPVLAFVDVMAKASETDSSHHMTDCTSRCIFFCH